jgi:hypothetical protein
MSFSYMAPHPGGDTPFSVLPAEHNKLRSIIMSRSNLVAFAAALGVSGLFFAAVLA